MVTHHQSTPGVAGDEPGSHLNVRPPSSNSTSFILQPRVEMDLLRVLGRRRQARGAHSRRNRMRAPAARTMRRPGPFMSPPRLTTIAATVARHGYLFIVLLVEAQLRRGGGAGPCRSSRRRQRSSGRPSDGTDVNRYATVIDRLDNRKISAVIQAVNAGCPVEFSSSLGDIDRRSPDLVSAVAQGRSTVS